MQNRYMSSSIWVMIISINSSYRLFLSRIKSAMCAVTWSETSISNGRQLLAGIWVVEGSEMNVQGEVGGADGDLGLDWGFSSGCGTTV